MNNELPADFDAEVPVYETGKSVATRSSSGEVINALAKKYLHSLEEVLTLLVLTKLLSRVLVISLQKLQKVATSGLVFVNLQWVQH